MYRSRLIRIAMTQPAWTHLDGLVAQSQVTTKPRAYGDILERLLATDTRVYKEPPPSWRFRVLAPPSLPVSDTKEDWQAWQMQKERTLLAAARQD